MGIGIEYLYICIAILAFLEVFKNGVDFFNEICYTLRQIEWSTKTRNKGEKMKKAFVIMSGLTVGMVVYELSKNATAAFFAACAVANILLALNYIIGRK